MTEAASGDNPFADASEARAKQAIWLLRRVRRISYARLGVTVSALLLALVIQEWERLSWWWLLVPGAGFLGLAIVHDRLFGRADELRRAAAWHRRAAQRVFRDTLGLPGEAGTPAAAIRGAKRPEPSASTERDTRLAERRHRLRALGDIHLAEQLDLFGAGQLYERLADWRTDPGGETLASWMLHPAPPEEAVARQQAVRELAPRVRLREELASGGGYREWPDGRTPVLPAWVGPVGGAAATSEGEAAADPEEAPEGPFPALPEPRTDRLRALSSVFLSAGSLVTLGLFLSGAAGMTPFVLVALAAASQGIFFRDRIAEHETAAKRVITEIGVIDRLGVVLEREEFASPALRRLGEELAGALPPLRRLLRLERRLRLRRNLVFAPVAALLFWGTHHALALNRWRRRHGEDLLRWGKAAGEFDALLALAQYQAERPGHVFASFDDEPGLEAVNLGHPLIPEARLQRNTVRLGRGDADVLIVTGSNMSGKSTLLRAIGTNFVLARMGAPVTATTFRLGPLALGASISVRDSLRDGVSRFLAELLALRRVMEAGSPVETLLFLLDEVLQGTNSNDRRLAAGALLGELGRRSAVGVMTTHDLSLTELDYEFPGRVRNLHFTERMTEGRMEFDYQLRDGVLPRGNALELMRILGLPAPEDGAGEFTSLRALGSGREH